MIRFARPDYVISQAAFEKLRNILLSQSRDEWLALPLAHWARPTDRNLPFVMLNRSLGEILQTPFEELYSTPSVGPKKIVGLMHLLERGAAGHDGSSVELPGQPQPPAAAKADPQCEAPAAIWDQWRMKIAAFGLQDEPLGRYARSLADLPRPLWAMPLGYYANLTLPEIANLPAHGEKRVASLLKVFDDLQHVLANMERLPHLTITILPELVVQLDHWVVAALERAEFPGLAELQVSLVSPLVSQIRCDAGPRLAEEIERALAAMVRRPASDPAVLSGVSSVSRFELHKAAEILRIRWPGGEAHLQALLARAAAQGSEDGCRLIGAVLALLFESTPAPSSQRASVSTLVISPAAAAGNVDAAATTPS